MPDIKVTQYSNFFSKLKNKASSEENLLSSRNEKYLSVQQETNLIKSVSDQNIFQNARIGSRSNLRTNCSCNGSFEFLSKNCDYFCPFSEDCLEKMSGVNLLQHFRQGHDGPLVQYYRKKISFKFEDNHEDTYCFYCEDKIMFLRIQVLDEL